MNYDNLHELDKKPFIEFENNYIKIRNEHRRNFEGTINDKLIYASKQFQNLVELLKEVRYCVEKEKCLQALYRTVYIKNLSYGICNLILCEHKDSYGIFKQFMENFNKINKTSTEYWTLNIYEIFEDNLKIIPFNNRIIFDDDLNPQIFFEIIDASITHTEYRIGKIGVARDYRNKSITTFK